MYCLKFDYIYIELLGYVEKTFGQLNDFIMKKCFFSSPYNFSLMCIFKNYGIFPICLICPNTVCT